MREVLIIRQISRLIMLSGIFNLLVVVSALCILIRPLYWSPVGFYTIWFVTYTFFTARGFIQILGKCSLEVDRSVSERLTLCSYYTSSWLESYYRHQFPQLGQYGEWSAVIVQRFGRVQRRAGFFARIETCGRV